MTRGDKAALYNWDTALRELFDLFRVTTLPLFACENAYRANERDFLKAD